MNHLSHSGCGFLFGDDALELVKVCPTNKEIHDRADDKQEANKADCFLLNINTEK